MATETSETYRGLDFFTVAEVAEIVRLSPMTVYRLIRSGELKTRRYGRSFRIPAAEVRALVEDGTGE